LDTILAKPGDLRELPLRLNSFQMAESGELSAMNRPISRDKLWEMLDREIGEPREHCGQIVTH
jgi:hypothetical protein